MSKIISFITIIILIISCNENYPKNIEFKIDNSKSEIFEFNISEVNIQNLKLKSENISGIFTEITVQDSLLICGNLYDPKLISIYSLKDSKALKTIIKRGTSTNEGLSASNFSFQNNTTNSSLWVYDITLGKLFKTDLSKMIKDSIFIAEKEMFLKGSLKNMVSPKILNDNSILATTYSLDDCRYFYSDGSKILKKVGKLPDVVNNKELKNISSCKIPNKANIFKAFSIKSPTEDKIAVFYNKADRAEFYANDKLFKIWNSTNSFNPKVEVLKLKDGYVVQDTDDTQYAYLSVTSDNNYIYALYAGNESSKTSSNTILIFDWSGDSVKKISLDRKVCKITLEPTKRILYCYDDITKTIFSTKL